MRISGNFPTLAAMVPEVRSSEPAPKGSPAPTTFLALLPVYAALGLLLSQRGLSKEIVLGLGRRIRHRRIQLGYAQRDVAERSGLDISFISLVEAGKRWFFLRSEGRVSLALQLPPYELTLRRLEALARGGLTDPAVVIVQGIRGLERRRGTAEVACREILAGYLRGGRLDRRMAQELVRRGISERALVQSVAQPKNCIGMSHRLPLTDRPLLGQWFLERLRRAGYRNRYHFSKEHDLPQPVPFHWGRGMVVTEPYHSLVEGALHLQAGELQRFYRQRYLAAVRRQLGFG